MIVNIYDLKNTIDKMIYQHENRIDAMSERVNLVGTKNGIELNHICEYPECRPNKYTIEGVC